MAAPTYLTPVYITYEMVEPLLRQAQIKVVLDPLDYSGIYKGQVENLIAMSESHIVITSLSSYLKIPLTTEDGGSFDDLLDNPEWKATYDQLKEVFIARSMVSLYANKMNSDGRLAASGDMLFKSQLSILNSFTAFINKLNQAGDIQLKNAFIGLKPCANASPRIPSKAGAPSGLPTGKDQSWQAINSVPNFRWSR